LAKFFKKKVVRKPLGMNIVNYSGRILKSSLDYKKKMKRACNTKQNWRINSLISSRSEIDLDASCDAQNSEPPGDEACEKKKQK
jgi:hypothetical protein